MSYNNNNDKDDVVVLLTWNSTPFRPTTYSPTELQHLRQSSGNGTGFKYFNPTTSNYERPRSMTVVPKKKLEDIQIRSARARKRRRKTRRRKYLKLLVS